ESELGGNRHLSLEGRQRFTDDFFVNERAIHLGRVKEGDAVLDGEANESNGVVAIGGGTVAEAQSHASKPEGRDFQVLSKFAFVHDATLTRATTGVKVVKSARTCERNSSMRGQQSVICTLSSPWRAKRALLAPQRNS